MGCQSHINCGFRTCDTDTTKCNNTVNNLDNFFIFDGVQNNKKGHGRLATYFKVGDPLVSLYNYSSRIVYMPTGRLLVYFRACPCTCRSLNTGVHALQPQGCLTSFVKRACTCPPVTHCFHSSRDYVSSNHDQL